LCKTADILAKYIHSSSGRKTSRDGWGIEKMLVKGNMGEKGAYGDKESILPSEKVGKKGR